MLVLQARLITLLSFETDINITEQVGIDEYFGLSSQFKCSLLFLIYLEPNYDLFFIFICHVTGVSWSHCFLNLALVP